MSIYIVILFVLIAALVIFNRAWKRRNANALFAEFGLRLAAIVFDIFIVMFLSQLANNYLLSAVGLRFDEMQVVPAVLLLYFTFSWTSPMHATPVQFLFNIRVVDKVGGKLTIARSAIRGIILTGLVFAAYPLLALHPNFPPVIVLAVMAYTFVFLAAVTPNRQAVHDFLAQSIVVNRAALKTPELRKQLVEHVADNDPVTRKRRRPSILSILYNLFVLGMPVFVLIAGTTAANDMNIRSRIAYALSETSPLKLAVETYYEDYQKMPMPAKELLGFNTKVNYPDGGYYQLEENGVIRIRFEVKRELKNISILLSPILKEDKITWQCRTEGDINSGRLPATCRH